jgi:hypothetical protein
LSEDRRTVHQTANRLWSSILGSICIEPHTGVYRWFSVVQHIGSKRSHCLCGLATGDSDLDAFLGQDAESWGVSAGGELFHGGVKTMAGATRALPVGVVYELIYDSDSGTLRGREAGGAEAAVLLFDDIPDVAVYPAWSLYAPGDTLAVVADPAERAKNSSNSNGSHSADNSSSNGAGSKASDVYTPSISQTSEPRTHTLDHCVHVITAATQLLAQDEHAVRLPLVSVLLPHTLGALAHYQRYPRGAQLSECLQALCEAVTSAQYSLNEYVNTVTEPSTPAAKAHTHPLTRTHTAAHTADIVDETQAQELLSQLACVAHLCLGRVLSVVASAPPSGGLGSAVLGTRLAGRYVQEHGY